MDPAANPDGAGAFAFRAVREADLALIAEWRARPHVVEWWDAPPSPHELREALLPSGGAGTDAVRAFIALLDGRPFGFIQLYVVRGAGDGWWPDETDPGARGIDQFVADERDLGRGLGTAMVRAFLAFVFADPSVSTVQVDPAPDNARAIRCYERAGFAKVGIIETPDGPALLMTRGREERGATSSR